jgi:DNA-binding NarL/FixJ family response regulator
MHPSIRVAIVSGDRIFREVLAASLSRHEGLEAAAVPVGVEGIAGEAPDGLGVVLIDASFDPRSALSQTWEVRARWPDAKIIAVGLDQEDERVVDFAEAGALGYVLQEETLDGLIAKVRTVDQGQTFCSPRILASVLARIASLSRLPAVPPRVVEPLTAREREILALLAAGLGNKEVGRRLRITLQTVKNHVHRILEKLQCHRRREAVRLAYDLGLLAEPLDVRLSGGTLAGGGRGEEGVDPF